MMFIENNNPNNKLFRSMLDEYMFSINFIN